MALKKRRLGDLYVVGKAVVIGDDSGEEPVTIWLQKLNPLEQETALRRANAARAQYSAFKRQKESDEYQAAMGEIEDYASRNTLIDLVARDAILTHRTRIEAEIAAEEEWSKDDYLQGLFDAWNGVGGQPGLSKRHEEEPDDETGRVYAELIRYNRAVEHQLESQRESIRRDYENKSDQELAEEAVLRVLDNRAISHFMDVYHAEQILAAVREEEDHRKPYFSKREEVAALDPQVLLMLIEHLQMITVDREEGKGSRGMPASSSSSAPSETEETEASSGLVVVSR